jgi:uncharacterized protein (DUF433 family)
MEIKSQDLPLHADAAGTVRLSGTRVPLETVVSVFHQGATPEEVVHRFPALDLADVYAVVGYYLRHPDEVQQYMARQTERAESVRGQVESRDEVQALRERLLDRKASRTGGT